MIDARRGGWRERKRAWIAVGLTSEEGRAEALTMTSNQARWINWYIIKRRLETEHGRTLTDDEVLELGAGRLRDSGGGTSVFDPVLTEILTAWYSPQGGHILDPWAGGSVRGIVTAAHGRRYTGIELRAEQVDANRRQLAALGPLAPLGLGPIAEPPAWIEGDSRDVLPTLDEGAFDLILGCPPYYDLEVYSDDPRDLSNLTPPQFDAAMADTIVKAARALRADSFAVFVVGAVRDKKGCILDMRRCMTDAATAAGMHLVQDAVLLTPIANAAVRAARAFDGTRSLARVHQEILIYVKGDRGRAAKRIGLPDFSFVGEVLTDEGLEEQPEAA